MLAHEYGHFLSYREQFGSDPSVWRLDEWIGIHDANVRLRDNSWTEDDYNSVIGEEEKAWDLALEVLEELKPAGTWSALAKAIRDERLKEYRNGPLERRRLAEQSKSREEGGGSS